MAIGHNKIVGGAPANAAGGLSSSGSAYIFDINGNQLAQISASDKAANDRFGSSVAVGSGKIVVGANRANNNLPGAAYIFDLEGNELKRIEASDGTNENYYGESVSVGCERIVVGAYDPVDFNSGKAYIYTLDYDGNVLNSSGYRLKTFKSNTGSIANTEVKIFQEEIGNFLINEFGYSLAIDSNRLYVGAANATEPTTEQGALYVFNLEGIQLERILDTSATGFGLQKQGFFEFSIINIFNTYRKLK